MRDAGTSLSQHSHRSPVAFLSLDARSAGSFSSNLTQSQEVISIANTERTLKNIVVFVGDITQVLGEIDNVVLQPHSALSNTRVSGIIELPAEGVSETSGYDPHHFQSNLKRPLFL
jgi:hypothetical protein